MRKTAGLADVLRELLRPLDQKIALAFVFGSVAQGKAGTGIDVDHLVVGSVWFASVVEVYDFGSERLGREMPLSLDNSLRLAFR